MKAAHRAAPGTAPQPQRVAVGVGVEVRVRVGLSVSVGVGVRVLVGGAGVSVGTAVGLSVGLGVRVTVGVGVEVGVGKGFITAGRYTLPGFMTMGIYMLNSAACLSVVNAERTAPVARQVVPPRSVQQTLSPLSRASTRSAQQQNATKRTSRKQCLLTMQAYRPNASQ